MTRYGIQRDADEAGAYEIERRLAQWMVRPVAFVESERIRSRFGHARIGGVKVEIMGAIAKRRKDGAWEQAAEVTRYRRIVTVRGMPVPVLSLEYEYDAYVALGRIERAEAIRRFLQTSRGGRP